MLKRQRKFDAKQSETGTSFEGAFEPSEMTKMLPPLARNKPIGNSAAGFKKAQSMNDLVNWQRFMPTETIKMEQKKMSAARAVEPSSAPQVTKESTTNSR